MHHGDGVVLTGRVASYEVRSLVTDTVQLF